MLQLLGSVADKAKSRMYSKEGAKEYNAFFSILIIVAFVYKVSVFIIAFRNMGYIYSTSMAQRLIPGIVSIFMRM